MKDVNKLDKNFIIKTGIEEPDIEWFDVREHPFSVHGVIFDEDAGRFLRFPQKEAERVSENVKFLNTHTSGGRVRFKTDSSYICIHAVMECSGIMSHMPRTGQSGFDLYKTVDGNEIYFATFIPPGTWEEGYSSGINTYGEMAEYISNMNMSVFVMDYDSNASFPEELEATHYPFYKIIRVKNSDLPIIIISHPSALHGVFYKTKGYEEWGTFEKRREIIKRTYDLARKEGDNNIRFVDGAEIFKGEEWDAVTVDGTHPNDFGFWRFAKYLEDILKPLL